jgi:hypothetical protein
MHLHNVFFALKDSSDEAVKTLVDDCYTYLKPQNGIEGFYAGPRETGCDREVNELDFHVALTVIFTDKAAHDAYQVSDKHNLFVDRNKDNWAGARVFDSLIS